METNSYIENFNFIDLLDNKNNLITGEYLQVVCAGIDYYFTERIDNSSLIIIEDISKDDYTKAITNKINKGSKRIKQIFKEYREYVQGYRPYELGEFAFINFTDFFGRNLIARESSYYQLAYVGKNIFVIERIEDAHIKEIYKIPKLKEV